MLGLSSMKKWMNPMGNDEISKKKLAELQEFDPELIVVFADKFNRSHFSVWEPYLSRIPIKIAICAKSCSEKNQNLTFPIFTQENGFDISHVGQLKNLRVLFYVSNFPNNWKYFYQFPRTLNINNDVTHVFAGHGDSDKESSFSKVSMIYDYLLVADDAAVARYHRNGVLIPNERFLLMGAPTMPGITVRPTSSKISTVLYAPTFEAKRADANFSSLEKIRELLIRASLIKQYNFLLRAHPSTGVRLPSYKDYVAELKSIFLTTPKSKVDAFNLSDAIITDISGVMTEYLFTGKPIILPLSQDDSLTRAVLEKSEVKDAVYVWNYESISLNDFLNSISHDPLSYARNELRRKKYLNANSFNDSLRNFIRVMGGFFGSSLESIPLGKIDPKQ